MGHIWDTDAWKMIYDWKDIWKSINRITQTRMINARKEEL